MIKNNDFKLSDEVKYKLSREIVDYLDHPPFVMVNTYEQVEHIIEIVEGVMRLQFEQDWEEIRGIQ